MNSLPASDLSLAVREASQNDLVRRKLDMDALRRRLGDNSTKQEKLRESCEGFEAIFLQKMWEQMRKTVPREGYMHSKDEEMYQSLFDIELCKKMASAGGIGLADMLYAQLSQQLENSGRTTTPSSYRNPLAIAPSPTLLPAPPRAAAVEGDPAPPGSMRDKKLTAADLYTPLDQDDQTRENFVPEEAGRGLKLADALRELRAEVDGASSTAGPSAVEEWAAARNAATGAVSPEEFPASSGGRAEINASVQTALPPGEERAAAQAGASSGHPAPPGAQGEDGSPRSAAADPALVSWQGAGPVSARPRSLNLFARNKNAAQARQAEAEKKTPVQPRGMAPQETLWPLSGEDNGVTSRFGWEDSPSGKRQWNSGVRISAAPGAAVRAVLPGTVVYAGPRDGFGNTVVLEHKDGYRSYYSNIDTPSVRVGEKIRHGAEFARIATQAPSGTIGENSSSLHFELKKGEMALNPESAIRRLTVAGR